RPGGRAAIFLPHPPPQTPPTHTNHQKKNTKAPPPFTNFPPPCATPFSNFSLDYRRSDARIVENGFAASSGVSKSAKVVLAPRRRVALGQVFVAFGSTPRSDEKLTCVQVQDSAKSFAHRAY